MKSYLVRAGACALLVTSLYGSSPAFWELSSYSEFLKGKFEHVALSRDGVLTVAPALDLVFSTGQAYLWSLARSPDGTIYAGTGNHGRLYRVDNAGKGEVIWTAPQPEIFAVAAASDGVVYAGTSPNGRIFRIENGRAAEYFDPKATYIWALAIGRDGALYAGTGGEGKVFRITAAGQGEEYFATGQTNVTGLAVARDGSLLAGTEPNGVLYRITAKAKAFAVYDSNLPEIRAMAEAADGSVYAAGLGGAVAKKAQSATQGAPAGTDIPAVTTSITVTASAAAAGEIKPPEPAKAAAAPATQPAVLAAAPAVEVTGVERSAIYQIHPDNTVETLWSSKEENVYDMLPGAGGLLFATDLGHIYRLDQKRRITLVVQTGEGDLNRLFRDGAGVLAAAGSGGKLYRLADRPRTAGGTYESPVFDAGAPARWGHIRRSGAGAVNLWTRSGNSLRPDRTWSDWSPVKPDWSVTSPNSRYLAWKAELPAGATVESIAVGYLPQN
ncbi:MAG: PQQ-binding-like beta-propeller repeat protein, partial [Actinomycetota bacterium]|nr:PQQ-binding-like beta-propeller repeat protein [Actinomycetota bacterium]